jgi:BirA family biotin operon repressor/biotin-[acetyl-CoA-carboxylase] ligase
LIRADTLMGDLISRLEHVGRVDSSQRIVREWLADDVPEVCVAVADEQTAGRGRLDRSWQAPPGRALLLSAGFRPPQLAAGHAWRVSATVAMAMREAALDATGAEAGELLLKWPNDIVVREGDGLLKVAGVLAEGVPVDGRMETVIVGVGVNVDWARADFPPDLAESMSSLREVAGGRGIDREALLDRFLALLAAGYDALRRGRFEASLWSSMQITTGATVTVDLGSGEVSGLAEGLDLDSGALLLREDAAGPVEAIQFGDVVRCRVSHVATCR